MIERQVFNQDKILKEDIAALLDEARGDAPQGMSGYRELEYCWRRKRFKKREQSQSESIVKRNYLFYEEFVDFMNYAGVPCSL